MKERFEKLSKKAKIIVISVIVLFGVGIVAGGSILGYNAYQQAETEKQIAVAEEAFQNDKNKFLETVTLFESNKQHLIEDEITKLEDIKLKTTDVKRESKDILDNAIKELQELDSTILLRHEGSINDKINTFILLDGFNEEEQKKYDELKSNIMNILGTKELRTLNSLYEQVAELDKVNPAIAYRIALEKGVHADAVLNAGGLAGIERVIQEEANRRYQQEQQNIANRRNQEAQKSNQSNSNNSPAVENKQPDEIKITIVPMPEWEHYYDENGFGMYRPKQ